MARYDEPPAKRSWCAPVWFLSTGISGWFACRWLLTDARTLRMLPYSVPVPFIMFTLALWMLGWVILGLAVFLVPVVRRRFLVRTALLLWIFSNGAGLVTVMYEHTQDPDGLWISSLIAGGLVLSSCALLMVIRARPEEKQAVCLSHVLSSVLFFAAFGLAAGMQQGYIFVFPGCGLFSTVLLLFINGGLEVAYARPGFTPVTRFLRTGTGDRGSAAGLHRRTWWRFHGVMVLLCGLFFSGILLDKTFTIVPESLADTRSIVLNSAPDDAWQWLVQPSYFLIWNTDFTEYIVPEVREEHVGTVFYLIGKRDGQLFMCECIVTRWEEPRAFAFSGSLAGYDVNSAYTLEPAGGGSVLICREEYRPQNLRERIIAVLTGKQMARSSLEERLSVLREVTGSR